MPRFRKKPVEIEARQMRSAYTDTIRLAEWCHGDLSDSFTEGPRITIHTLEGDHLAQPGDWIIKGIQGEFYPCKPDIFNATYEPAEVTATATYQLTAEDLAPRLFAVMTASEEDGRGTPGPRRWEDLDTVEQGAWIDDAAAALRLATSEPEDR